MFEGSTKNVSETEYSPLGIPLNYDPRYRINVCLMSKDAEDFIKRGRLVDYEVDKELTRERVQQFRSILHHYLDFSQKQKFQKLRKILQDQKNLPIYQYKEKIVSMIQQHQIVVVAGDTGCGKSTQVQLGFLNDLRHYIFFSFPFFFFFFCIPQLYLWGSPFWVRFLRM